MDLASISPKVSNPILIKEETLTTEKEDSRPPTSLQHFQNFSLKRTPHDSLLHTNKLKEPQFGFMIPTITIEDDYAIEEKPGRVTTKVVTSPVNMIKRNRLVPACQKRKVESIFSKTMTSQEWIDKKVEYSPEVRGLLFHNCLDAVSRSKACKMDESTRKSVDFYSRNT